MKIKNLIPLFLLALISIDSEAYKLVVNKTKLGGDGSDHYNYVNREVLDDIVDIEGVQKLQSRTVNIFCEGIGNNSCPNNVAYDGGSDEEIDQPSLSVYFTAEAINAAQNILNQAEYESSQGQNDGANEGTIMTPDGRFYVYFVSWERDENGDTNIHMTFEDAPEYSHLLRD